MSSVSILHAPRDSALGDKIAAALSSAGLAATRTDGAHSAAGEDGAAIVVWTEAAARLARLHEQAMQAMARGALIPVAVGGALPPEGFETLPPVDLSGWTGAADDPRWRFVLEEVLLAAQRLSLRDGTVWTEPETDPWANENASERDAPPAVESDKGMYQPPPHLLRQKPRRRFSAKEVALGATSGLVAMTVAMALLAPLVMPVQPDLTPVAAQPQGETAVPDPSPSAPSGLASLRVEKSDPPPTDVGGAAPDTAPLDQPAAEEEADDDALARLIAAVNAEAPEAPQVAAATGATKTGAYFRDCSDCPDMATAPAGAFHMGAAPGETAKDATETPRLLVTIAKPFAIGASEVTFAQWDSCVAGGGCNAAPHDHGWGRGQMPAVNVSYEDALAYAAWLSQKTGEAYRLPSEAEWEYAARAGGEAAFSFGSGVSVAQANFNGQFPYRGKVETFRGRTMPAASFPPNAFGLYDMHGNVWEWTADCWNPSHAGSAADGSAVTGGDCARRVLKGGAWNTGAWRLRSAHRIAKPATSREFDNGFRVARDLG